MSATRPACTCNQDPTITCRVHPERDSVAYCKQTIDRKNERITAMQARIDALEAENKMLRDAALESGLELSETDLWKKIGQWLAG